MSPDPFLSVDDLLSCRPVEPGTGVRLGTSREGRAIEGFRLGSGPVRVSLLGGCHADEPVGPDLLRRLCTLLRTEKYKRKHHSLFVRYEWWILPHVNPDGAARNRVWQEPAGGGYTLGHYLANVVRELPGDDIEFGFPREESDTEARPENRAADAWWRSAAGPFHLHVSAHGMGFGGGPWFLIDREWIGRTAELRAQCARAVRELGYRLHDVDREGEKGFTRIERGFCTRPDSEAMREHFVTVGDEETANRFRPSSMESVRSLGGDPLTLVTEMPLFITPGVGESLGPPDAVGVEWKSRVERWKVALAGGEAEPVTVTREAESLGLRAMPIRDQQRLQWRLITAGLEAAAAWVEE